MRGSVPRDVGSVLLRDVVFVVTFWNSNFGGGVLFHEGSIGSFRSGTGGSFFLVLVEDQGRWVLFNYV